MGVPLAFASLPCLSRGMLLWVPITPVFGSLVSDCDEERIVPILVFFRQPQVGWCVVEKSLDKFDINVTDEPEWRSGTCASNMRFRSSSDRKDKSGHARGARTERSRPIFR